MIDKAIEMYSNVWEVLALFGGAIVGFAISIFIHELGHYLAILYFKGRPRFGYFGKGILRGYFVTSEFGDSFYWNLFFQDRPNAWKKQIVISGSGLFASFLSAAISLWVAFLTANMDVPFVICVLTGLLGFYNFTLFFANLLSSKDTSDGFKVRRALKCRKAYVCHLEEIGCQFTPKHLKSEVARFQKDTSHSARK